MLTKEVRQLKRENQKLQKQIKELTKENKLVKHLAETYKKSILEATEPFKEKVFYRKKYGE